MTKRINEALLEILRSKWFLAVMTVYYLIAAYPDGLLHFASGAVAAYFWMQRFDD